MADRKSARPLKPRRGKVGRRKRDPKPEKILGRELKTARALELAQDGWSYAAIAETLTAELGEQYGPTRKTHAFELVKEALEEATQRRKDAADSVITLEIGRLDEMMIGVFPKAKQGDTFAVSSVLAIMQHRARLLGMNAPTKVETTGKDGGPIESSVAIQDAANEFDRKLARKLAVHDARLAAGEPDGPGEGG